MPATFLFFHIFIGVSLRQNEKGSPKPVRQHVDVLVPMLFLCSVDCSYVHVRA
jgi:hypothetical protein